MRSVCSTLPLWGFRDNKGGEIMDWYGYTGKILNVDLTEDKTSIIKENLGDLKRFIGGFGMNCLLGAERIKPNTDPLSRNNIIIIGTGPLVGTITPGASRTAGLSKFPATGALANSCGSMSFGFHLKNAGFDHIIISGKAEKPSFLQVVDDHVELYDASDIWGRDIVETTDFLWKKHGSSGVIAIGQAGENLVRGALSLIDKTSTFGRGGLGAVMGAKNLKAIVAQGTKGISIARPKEFNKVFQKLFERIRNYPQRKSWHEVGMLRSLPIGLMLTAQGQKKKARQCSDRLYLKKLKKRRIACPSCPMADKDVLEIREGEHCGLIHYTSSVINPFLMFTLKDLNTYDEAVKIFDLTNRYGLDSLTITALFEFLTRLYEQGIITKETMGIEWKSDYETLAKVIEMIAYRRDLGDILAEGWKEIGKKYNIEDKMLEVKGLDVIFDPRFMRLGTMEFEQIVNVKGAHVASGGSPTYATSGGSMERFETHFKRMGIPDPAIKRIFQPLKKEMMVNVPRLTRYSEDWYALLTSMGLCARAQMNRFYSLKNITTFFNAVTGFDVSEEDLRMSAERSWNLLKLLNAKEGFSRKDDKFPKEWFKSLKYGNTELQLQDFFGTTIITPTIANNLLDDYYDERGWNMENGLPSEEKIVELGLEIYL